MDEIRIPSQLKPTVEKLYDDLSAVLIRYENKDIDADGLYDFMVALHNEISVVIYND